MVIALPLQSDLTGDNQLPRLQCTELSAEYFGFYLVFAGRFFAERLMNRTDAWCFTLRMRARSHLISDSVGLAISSTMDFPSLSAPIVARGWLQREA
jgi:hypothetical protein